jgi:hypothetical protein
MQNSQENSQELSHLHFLWDESSIENAVIRFRNLTLNNNLNQFSLKLELHLEDDELGDLTAWNDLLEDFFKNHGQNCQNLEIKIGSLNQDVYKIIFSKFRYLSNLKIFQFIFCNSDDSSDEFRLLAYYILQLPCPEKITALNLSMINIITNEPNNELSNSEINLLNFIDSCHSLKKINVLGNYISILFYQNLNLILKNLPHLENVCLEYQTMGANLSPMIEILQNQNVKEFSYTLFGETNVLNKGDTPKSHLMMIQNTLRQNRGLKSLYLNFSNAFRYDEGVGLFDNNENQFLTSQFLKLLKSICSMYWLEKIEIKLPLLLAEIMDDDIHQYEELKMLFNNIKISTQQADILFEINNNQNQELEKMALATSEKREKIRQAISRTEPVNFLIGFHELFTYPNLVSAITKNNSLIESLHLDLNLYYYLVQHLSLFQTIDHGDFNFTIPIKNLLDAISLQFFHKIQFLQKTSENELVTYHHRQYMPCDFEIFKYLDIKDLLSLMLTVGGLHCSLKIQLMKSPNSHSFFQSKQANNPIDSRLMLADCTISGEHLYTSEDIYTILKVRFKDRNDIHVMGPLQFSESRFKLLLMNAITNHPEGKLLFPIHIEHHWVGISLTRTSHGYVINFYDSLISNERFNTIKNEVLSYFEDIPVVFNPMKAPYLQPDLTSCGAYLIENMFRDFHHLPIDEKICPESIIGLHLKLLRDYEPTYLTISNKRKRRDANDHMDEFAPNVFNKSSLK